MLVERINYYSFQCAKSIGKSKFRFMSMENVVFFEPIYSGSCNNGLWSKEGAKTKQSSSWAGLMTTLPRTSEE